MKQKIEWYREVLDLEPNSRVFFPLARLLSEDGQVEESLAVLRQGVQRHPDHLEARLLLIEQMFAFGRHDGLWREVDHVSGLFGGYPGFWAAWSERLAERGERDAGLALRFLNACLQGKKFSWADVIAEGLGKVLGEGVMAFTRGPAQSPGQPSGQGSGLDSGVAPEHNFGFDAAPDADVKGAAGLNVPAQAETEFAEASEQSEPPEQAEQMEFTELLDDLGSDEPADVLAFAPELPGLMPDILAEQPSDVAEGDDDDGENDEPFSLRTRSMADILTEQGDYEGSLDIYGELLSAASDDAERAELSAKMNEIRSRLSEPQLHQADEGGDELHSAPGKNRLRDVLESLVQRLEARA